MPPRASGSGSGSRRGTAAGGTDASDRGGPWRRSDPGCGASPAGPGCARQPERSGACRSGNVPDRAPRVASGAGSNALQVRGEPLLPTGPVPRGPGTPSVRSNPNASPDRPWMAAAGRGSGFAGEAACPSREAPVRGPIAGGGTPRGIRMFSGRSGSPCTAGRSAEGRQRFRSAPGGVRSATTRAQKDGSGIAGARSGTRNAGGADPAVPRSRGAGSAWPPAAPRSPLRRSRGAAPEPVRCRTRYRPPRTSTAHRKRRRGPLARVAGKRPAAERPREGRPTQRPLPSRTGTVRDGSTVRAPPTRDPGRAPDRPHRRTPRAGSAHRSAGRGPPFRPLHPPPPQSGSSASEPPHRRRRDRPGSNRTGRAPAFHPPAASGRRIGRAGGGRCRARVPSRGSPVWPGTGPALPRSRLRGCRTTADRSGVQLPGTAFRPPPRRPSGRSDAGRSWERGSDPDARPRRTRVPVRPMRRMRLRPLPG